MERLTDKNFRIGFDDSDKLPSYVAIYERLRDYENLEEQGKLPKLPCAVGDTVYAYCSVFGILAYVVDCIVIDKNITFQCSSFSEPIGDCSRECLDEIDPDISDFGKTVFLTIKEAEGKLAEMEGKKCQK